MTFRTPGVGELQFLEEGIPKRVSFDFNGGIAGGVYGMNESSVSDHSLGLGEKVVLFDDDGETWLECDAIVRKEKKYGWVAHILEGTFRDVPKDQESK